MYLVIIINHIYLLFNKFDQINLLIFENNESTFSVPNYKQKNTHFLCPKL